MKEIDATDGRSVSFCRESCSRTFFFCPHCGEANRPLARFCRRCSEPVSYVEAETSFEKGAPFNVKVGGAEAHPLARYAVKETHSLTSYLGFLFVITDGELLIFDTHSLHEPLRIFSPQDGRTVRGVDVKSSVEDVRLLLTTAKTIYQLSLIELDTPATEVYKVSQSSRSIYHSAFYCADDIYFLEYDESDETSRLIRFPDQVVASFKGFSRRPLAVSNDQIFLCTENQIFLYDTRHNALKAQKSPEYLSRFADPAYSDELTSIYFVGENKLWRLGFGDPEISPLPLNTTAVGDPRIAASGDQLFVARSTGLLILSPFGDVQWDSSKNFISASSDLRAPQIYSDALIFTAVGRLGGSDVRVHQRSNPGRFDLVSYEKRLTCSPVLSLGRLIAVVGEDSAMELRVN